MCVRGMQAKIPVLPFQGKLFGDHHIFQLDLFFLFCEFVLLQKGADCPLRDSFCLFWAHILPAILQEKTQ